MRNEWIKRKCFKTDELDEIFLCIFNCSAATKQQCTNFQLNELTYSIIRTTQTNRVNPLYQVWLENEDVTLYLILPHSITTYTIDMSYDNVCMVLYKQHKSLWSALHIGHSEEEVGLIVFYYCTPVSTTAVEFLVTLALR